MRSRYETPYCGKTWYSKCFTKFSCGQRATLRIYVSTLEICENAHCLWKSMQTFWKMTNVWNCERKKRSTNAEKSFCAVAKIGWASDRSWWGGKRQGGSERNMNKTRSWKVTTSMPPLVIAPLWNYEFLEETVAASRMKLSLLVFKKQIKQRSGEWRVNIHTGKTV